MSRTGTKYHDQHDRIADPGPAAGAGPEPDLRARVQRSLGASERAADELLSDDPQTTLRKFLQSDGQ